MKSANKKNSGHILLRAVMPVALIALGILGVAQTAKGAVVASDTFGGATDGTPLNGRITEVGGLTWKATTNVGISSGAVSVFTLGTGFDWGGVPFSAAGSDNFAVSASLNPTDNSSQWVAIGFMMDANQSLLADPNAVLWALLRGTPDYQLFEDVSGTRTMISAGTAPIYSTGFNEMSLLYDVSSTVVTLTINGTNVFNGPAVAAINVAGIGAGGFTMSGQEPSPVVGQLDNFQLTAEAPEPATALLLWLGGGVLWMHKHKLIRGRS